MQEEGVNAVENNALNFEKKQRKCRRIKRGTKKHLNYFNQTREGKKKRWPIVAT